MNRLVASFAALLLAASVFGGCTPKETPPQGEPSGSSSQVEENNSSQEDSSSRRLTVADAALYRGEVRGLDENGFYLVQVPGRDYGDGIVRFSIGEGTKFSFDRETLEEGQYLEVYYSDVQETYPPQTEAIAVNRLPDAAMSVFNGEVVEVTEKEDGTTDLLMKRIDPHRPVPPRTVFLGSLCPPPGGRCGNWPRGYRCPQRNFWPSGAPSGCPRR